MKTLFATAVITAALAMPAQAWPAQPWALITDRDASKFTGQWYTVEQDGSKYTIERTSDGLQMLGPDYFCAIRHLQIHQDDIGGLSEDGQSDCSGKGGAARGTWLIGLFDSGYLAVVEHITATDGGQAQARGGSERT